MQPCRKDTPRCGGAPADLSASGPLLAKAETTASGRRGGIRPESHLAEYSRSEEHTSELQSRLDLVCRLLLEKKKKNLRLFWVTHLNSIRHQAVHKSIVQAFIRIVLCIFNSLRFLALIVAPPFTYCDVPLREW